ncbi:nucleotidyltransferase domain-containing protein [Shigella phage SGF2]|uniref:Nucleotidyltransferase domain-containing protein n=1 Tax=Shigella phage SGF2 TaxID=2601630 RepID=A0A5C1K9H3_9CAUD|nr:nucleotidyltransferase [Shigella phage SGF2]QEM42642.1 nucleotidyltransferase domain-containing protein [Shigella phage SGF2]
MIVIPINRIEDKVAQQPDITVGRHFIEQLINNNLVPDGICPIITGGAVRDAVLNNTAPHDIDIFIVRGQTPITQNTFTPTDRWQALGREIESNVKEWLESQDIEYASLLAEATNESYAGGSQLTFTDIIEFQWNGTRIQFMFNYPTSIEEVLDNFPMMCRGAITLDSLFMTPHGYLAMTAPCPVVVSSREIRYVHKKWPNSQVLRFSAPSVAYQYMAQTRYLPTPQPVSHLVNERGQVAHVEDTTSAQYCVNRDMSRFFGIPYEEIQLMSSVHGSGQIRAYWSEGLTNLTTNTGGDLLGREDEPNRHNAIEGVFVAPAMRRAQESRRESPTRRTSFEEALGITSDSMERWMARPSRGRPNGLTVSARQFSGQGFAVGDINAPVRAVWTDEGVAQDVVGSLSDLDTPSHEELAEAVSRSLADRFIANNPEVLEPQARTVRFADEAGRGISFDMETNN